MKGSVRCAVLMPLLFFGAIPPPASGLALPGPASGFALPGPASPTSRVFAAAAPAAQSEPGEGRSGGADPEELFRQGNRLYEEGDFAPAVEAYRAVAEAGFESADLYFNLGNAHFKNGNLGRAILSWERALRLRPRDRDTRANLELARSLTADEIEPLPRFWLLSVLSWWVNLLPRGVLALLLGLSYVSVTAGACVLVLSRAPLGKRLGTWAAIVGLAAGVLFGGTLLARAGSLGGNPWGIILAEAVPVQSAPSEDPDLTLFLVHEGTRVRIDQSGGTWLEVVLEDGRVGWVPAEVLEII